MTMKGTTDIGKIHINRICSLARELSKINAKYKIEIFPKTMQEYEKFKKEWAGFVDLNTWLSYKNLLIHKPKKEFYNDTV